MSEMNVNRNGVTQKAIDLVKSIAGMSGDKKKIDTAREFGIFAAALNNVLTDEEQRQYGIRCDSVWCKADKEYLDQIYKETEEYFEQNKIYEKEMCEELKRGVQEKVIKFIKSPAKSNFGLDKKEIDCKQEAQALVDFMNENKNDLGQDDIWYIKDVLAGAGYGESKSNPGTVTKDENDMVDDINDFIPVNSNGNPL